MKSYSDRIYLDKTDVLRQKSAMGEHNGSQVVLILINTLLFLSATALVHLWAFPQYAGGLFLNEITNLTLTYEIPVTPSTWTMILWTVIMAWLLICKIYTLILLCRKNAVGPLYKSPPVIGHWFLLAYSLSLFCLIAWTIVFDRDLVVAGTILMFLAAIFCWLATAALYKSVYGHGAWLARHARGDLWMYRILWHNGMTAFTAWLSIQAIYLLGVTLRVEVGMALQDIVYVVFGIISGILVVWFLLENTVLDRYGRYSLAQYMVVVVVVVGVYTRQYNGQFTTDITKYFIIALLAAAVFCLVVRLVLAIVRAIRCPLYMHNKVGEDPVISFSDE